MELIMDANTEYQKYLAAQKRVKEIKEFYASLVPFILVNSGLLFLNLRYSPHHLWFLYPFESF
jgi:2TM domain